MKHAGTQGEGRLFIKSSTVITIRGGLNMEIPLCELDARHPRLLNQHIIHKQALEANAALMRASSDMFQVLDKLLTTLDEFELTDEQKEVIVPIMAEAEKIMKLIPLLDAS